MKVDLKTFCSKNQAKTDQNLLSWPEVLVEEKQSLRKAKKVFTCLERLKAALDFALLEFMGLFAITFVGY